MAIFPAPLSKSPSWPITIGSEGIAAAQFARCGFDVLVQAKHAGSDFAGAGKDGFNPETKPARNIFFVCDSNHLQLTGKDR